LEGRVVGLNFKLNIQ